MKLKLLAVLVAAAALPLAAQAASARPDPLDAAPKTQAKEDKPASGVGLTDRERARLAKAQNQQKKQDCGAQIARKKPDSPRKQSPAG